MNQCWLYIYKKAIDKTIFNLVTFELMHDLDPAVIVLLTSAGPQFDLTENSSSCYHQGFPALAQQTGGISGVQIKRSNK